MRRVVGLTDLIDDNVTLAEVWRQVGLRPDCFDFDPMLGLELSDRILQLDDVLLIDHASLLLFLQLGLNAIELSLTIQDGLCSAILYLLSRLLVIFADVAEFAFPGLQLR